MPMIFRSSLELLRSRRGSRVRALLESIEPLVLLSLLLLVTRATGGRSYDKKLVLVLDVDNTLYSEDSLRLASYGMEQQIVRNIHNFCLEYLSMDEAKADELHRTYGSTVEGLRCSVWKDLSRADLALEMEQCYDHVYHPSKMDYSPLLRISQQLSASSSAFSTGYSHVNHQAMAKQNQMLRDLLTKWSHHNDLYLASNSPSWHVQRVLQALGLASIRWSGILTPDTIRHDDHLPYPTKHAPLAFFDSLAAQYPPNTDDGMEDMVILDDSQSNLNALMKNSDNLRIRGIRVTPDYPIVPALLQAWGVTRPSKAVVQGHQNKKKMKQNTADSNDIQKYVGYQFSQVQYLQAKNVVDAQSFHRPTWHKVAAELARILSSESESPPSNNSSANELTIVDVGAGLLSMLKFMLLGDKDSQLPSLVSLVVDGYHNKNRDHESKSTSLPPFQRIRYFAYEPNRDLKEPCMEVLKQLGFQCDLDDNRNDRKEWVFVRHDLNGVEVVVHLRLYDYNDNSLLEYDGNDDLRHPDPHLIVGCCFADLMEPSHLAASLLDQFLSRPAESSVREHLHRTHCVCYFPITFQGITQFLPPQPFEIIPPQRSTDEEDGRSRRGSCVPSDTVAFTLYSKALEEQHGHNLDPRRFIQAMNDFGATLVSSGSSNWDIDPTKHSYLWETMMYFFEGVAGPELLKYGWDAPAWFHRARRGIHVGCSGDRSKPQSSLNFHKPQKMIDGCPCIEASNLDLLFRVPRLGCVNLKFANPNVAGEGFEMQDEGIEEIQFVAPRQVTTIHKSGSDLGPNQIRIKSEFSLISSGTELKIFKGMFDDAQLDVNIKGMDAERMAYPLAYGYSLVGRVVQCGSAVEDADELRNKLVFAFSAHASHVITDRSSIHIVPDGIEAQDAIFMPSVETAISLVHDAHVRPGENIAVFGQGLIGLLCTAILRMGSPQAMDLYAPSSTDLGKKLGTVSTFDTVPSRLAASAAMGASQALLPSEARESGPFDVSIEVSGNGRALQSAIDNTINHGRIIVGSWYGNSDVALKLGIDFHRSHKTITTSQVSELKADLSGIWSKARRFGLTWDILKKIQPSKLITLRTKLKNAQEAYEALDIGTEIAVAFEYQ